jgi:hypothetical protein
VVIALADQTLVVGLCAWAAGGTFVWAASHLRPLRGLALRSVPVKALALVLMVATLVFAVRTLGNIANLVAGLLTGVLCEFVLPTRDRRRRLAAIADQ